MMVMHVGRLSEYEFCSVVSRGCTLLAALSPVAAVRPAGSGGADLGRLDPRQRPARGMVTPARRGLEHSKIVAKAPWPHAAVRLPVPAISAALPAHRKWSSTLHRDTFSVLSPIGSGLGLSTLASRYPLSRLAPARPTHGFQVGLDSGPDLASSLEPLALSLSRLALSLARTSCKGLALGALGRLARGPLLP